MRVRIILTGVFLSLLGSVVLLAQAPDPPAPPPFSPVASLETLMQAQEDHFHQISKLLDDTDARGRARRLAATAEIMAELANVSAYHRDRKAFRAFAIEVRDRAVELAREAGKAANADETRMRAIFQKIEANCTGCHDL